MTRPTCECWENPHGDLFVVMPHIEEEYYYDVWHHRHNQPFCQFCGKPAEVVGE